MQILAGGETEVEFGCKFQLGATPRWNLDANSSWVLGQDKICVRITARSETEMEFGSKFQLGEKLRWNLDPNSSWGRSPGGI